MLQGRGEELITTDEELKRIWILRKYLNSLEDVQAIEFLVDRDRRKATASISFLSR